MAEEHRSICANALNQYIEKNVPGTGIAICSRFKEYSELKTKLKLNGAIRLESLSRTKVLSYISKSGPAYEGLHHILENDISFIELAETPFMLSLLMNVFRGISTEKMKNIEKYSFREKKNQIMGAYVNRQFRRIENFR